MFIKIHEYINDRYSKFVNFERLLINNLSRILKKHEIVRGVVIRLVYNYKMLYETYKGWKRFNKEGMDEFKVKLVFSILLENYPHINLCMLYYICSALYKSKPKSFVEKI